MRAAGARRASPTRPPRAGQAATVAELQLAQQRRHVALDGAHRDRQRVGDLHVRQVARQQVEDLLFTRCHRAAWHRHAVSLTLVACGRRGFHAASVDRIRGGHGCARVPRRRTVGAMSTTTSTPTPASVSTDALLTDEMLARFDERAPRLRPRQPVLHRGLRGAARQSATCTASLPDRVRRAGPRPAEINRLQRRIAYVAPATAVAVNMHHYFVGLCADLHRAGDPSGDWVLDARPPRATCFAAGHGEAGNDIPVLLSSSKAERVDGGWEITGHKIFGSLSPVWTYLGVHAMDTSDPANPQIVHAFVAPRRARLPHRGDVGHARHAGDDVERHDPRPHVRARRGDDPGVPGRVRRRRHVPRRAVRLGAARLRRRLLGDRPAGLRRDRRRACTSARRSR